VAIAVAGTRLDGLGDAEVVDHRPGIGWVVWRLLELADKWSPCAIVVNDTGPRRVAGRAARESRARGHPTDRPARVLCRGGRTVPARCLADGAIAALSGARSARSAMRRGPGPARDCRPTWRRWSRCRWPAGATPPGRTGSTGNRRCTSETLRPRRRPCPGVVARTGAALESARSPGSRWRPVDPRGEGGSHHRPP
jgi:hypothetical protein